MKLVIISGGSQGLGKALVELYTKKNWKVIEFSRSGVSSAHVQCDFSVPTEASYIVENIFNTLVKEDSINNFDEIILINNAGMVGPVGKIEHSSIVEWQNNINVNLLSCVLLTGLFQKIFRQTTAKKMIANISSGAALSAFYGWSLYCSAKAAMESFTDCTAIEEEKCANPIIPFVIYPGVIDTAMQGDIREQNEENFPDLQRFITMKKEGILDSPEKVASAIFNIFQTNPIAANRYDVRSFF